MCFSYGCGQQRNQRQHKMQANRWAILISFVAAAMVDDLDVNHKNTNKTQLLVSNYGTNQSLVVCEN
jgi:hypothetical protein